MPLSCRQATRVSLDAVANQATEVERLELEDHLASCPRCAEDHALVGLVRRLREPQTGLSDTARQRVRRKSLLAAQERGVAPRVPGRVRLGWIGAGAASAVAAALVIALWPPTSRVVDGEVSVDGVVAHRIRDGAELRTGRGGRVVLRGAATELTPGTIARWQDGARSLELERGSVTVEVTPGEGQRFQVATARFVVQVVGTVFTVTPESVSTARGRVRVIDKQGTLLAIVSAGERWQVAEMPTEPAAAPSLPLPPAVAPSPPVAAPVVAPVAGSPAAPSPLAARPRPAREPLAARDPLAAARTALAQGHADHARALLSPLLGGPRKSAVEARALLAESFLVEGRYADATDSYRAVVRDFAGTVQAESALYAIAQLEGETGHAAQAAATLRQYLAQYPRGRFAKEARERLNLNP